MGRKIKHFTFILPYPRLFSRYFHRGNLLSVHASMQYTIAYGEITFLRENEFSHCVNVRDINFTKQVLLSTGVLIYHRVSKPSPLCEALCYNRGNENPSNVTSVVNVGRSRISLVAVSDFKGNHRAGTSVIMWTSPVNMKTLRLAYKTLMTRRSLKRVICYKTREIVNFV